MSLAIINSSLVGITHTLTLESEVEIIPSLPMVSKFAFSSSVIPRNCKRETILPRINFAFSPTPAQNEIASTPVNAAV